MPKIAEKETNFNVNTEEMAQAGLHFGHRTSKINPKISPFLYGARNNVHIFDLDKTSEKLKEALAFIQELISENKTLLLVGTKIQAKELTRETAKECNLPYVVERWLGGTLTNFEIIKKRLDYFKNLEAQRDHGELEKYTKKEQSKMGQELKKLEIKFGGIKNMDRVPEAILVLDMKKDILAVREAKAKGIKVIGVADTNIDPNLADFAIPANDDAISAIRYILEKVKEVILRAKAKAPEAEKNE